MTDKTWAYLTKITSGTKSDIKDTPYYTLGYLGFPMYSKLKEVRDVAGIAYVHRVFQCEVPITYEVGDLCVLSKHFVNKNKHDSSEDIYRGGCERVLMLGRYTVAGDSYYYCEVAEIPNSETLLHLQDHLWAFGVPTRRGHYNE